QPRLRVHGDPRVREGLSDADPGPAGRYRGAFIGRRDRERDARAKGPAEHVPLERHAGEDSAGRAPRSQLPAVASAGPEADSMTMRPALSHRDIASRASTWQKRADA